MEYRTLGNSGLQVSVVGLGTNNFGWRVDGEQAIGIVNTALDEGVNFIDTSDSYGPPDGLSEQYIGKAIESRRHEVVLGTKFSSPMGEGPYLRGASRRYIMDAVEDSLRRLNTDYIDLYQYHWPDPKTPIEETLRALDDLVRRGVVRYVGCSNFSAAQAVESQWTARTEQLTPFIAAQNQYSLLNRRIETELMPMCRRYGLGVIPFSPLASGVLTGKYRSGEPPPEGTRLAAMRARASTLLNDETMAIVEGLEKIAGERGHTLLELAMSWLAAQPAVASVIAGATSPEQVRQNVASMNWTMTADDLAAIDEVTEPGGGPMRGSPNPLVAT